MVQISSIGVLGIKTVQNMAKTEAFKSVGAKPIEVHHPRYQNHKYRSDDYWRCYIRHNTLTVYKMGSKNDN